MNEGYISSIYGKDAKRKMFFNSLFFKISLITLVLVTYIFTLSPIVEGVLKSYVLNEIRESKKVTLNYLTPLYAPDMYTNEYSLNTLTSGIRKIESRTDIRTEDPRVIVMEKFLLNYNSPMYPFARVFINEADKYGLDWRLVASISGVESAFGNIIPRGTHNAWGWRGINKNPEGWSQFPSWNASIAEVTRGLAQGYGITMTPFQIEPYYCPPCGANPAHAWANGVTRYMRELKYYLDNLR